MLITIIASVVGFGLLIFFHELGHFFAAKRIGVKVEKFSLGYGPELFGFTKGGTRYCVSAFPLGGFVKLSGENAVSGKNIEKEFLNSRSIGERIFVYLLGPLFNFILAFFLFAFVFGFGISALDMESTAIGRMSDGYPAQAAGLKPGDEIKSVNGENVKDWMEVQGGIRKASNGTIVLRVAREGKELVFNIEPKWDKQMQGRIIGISPREVLKKYSFFESIKEGFVHTGVMIYAVVKGLFMIVFGKAKLDVAGPIGIFQMLGSQAKEGASSFFYFIGFLSINLGILNLVPVPIFDGGVIMLLLVEAIRRKPVSDKSRMVLEQIGIALVIALMVYATFKDIIRIR